MVTNYLKLLSHLIFYENSNKLELSYLEENLQFHINYIDFTGDINLNYADEDIIFYNKPLHKDLISKQIVYSINDYNYDSQSKLGLRVWDITDPYDIAELNLRKENSFYYFLQNEKNYSRNIIFDINNLDTPKFFGERSKFKYIKPRKSRFINNHS